MHGRTLAALHHPLYLTCIGRRDTDSAPALSSVATTSPRGTTEVHTIVDLIEAADTGQLSAEHGPDIARWLRWADVHYPLVAGIRAIADLDVSDPAEPAMAEVA